MAFGKRLFWLLHEKPKKKWGPASLLLLLLVFEQRSTVAASALVATCSLCVRDRGSCLIPHFCLFQNVSHTKFY